MSDEKRDQPTNPPTCTCAHRFGHFSNCPAATAPATPSELPNEVLNAALEAAAKHPKATDAVLRAVTDRLRMGQEKPVCDVCGVEDDDERVFGKVEVCRACYMAAQPTEQELRLRRVLSNARALSKRLEIWHSGAGPEYYCEEHASLADSLQEYDEQPTEH